MPAQKPPTDSYMKTAGPENSLIAKTVLISLVNHIFKLSIVAE